MEIQERTAKSLAHRDKMAELEAAMIEFGTPAELEEKHYFAHGTYTRELFIPKGTTLTGKIHRHSCINIISQGKIRVITDEGEYDIEAPHTMVSGEGVKKAGYALEDTVWINVHPWDGVSDLNQLEQQVIAPSYESLDYEEKLCLG